jgi:hypothetical protein
MINDFGVPGLRASLDFRFQMADVQILASLRLRLCVEFRFRLMPGRQTQAQGRTDFNPQKGLTHALICF